MDKKRYRISLVFIGAAAFLLAAGCAQPAPKPQAAAEAPKPAPKAPTEKTYAEEFDRVWGAVVEVLTERGLSEHPHGKMSADKGSGKITTPIFRYFKISSAKPIQEKDYRDSYTITVASEAKAKADAAKAKQDEAEAKGAEAKEKTGDEAKALAKEAQKLSDEAAVAAGEAKRAAEAPKAVTVKIQRKFEMFDNAKRAWTEADPTPEKVGYTEEQLLSAVDGKVAAAAPAAASANAAPPPNLNLTPPLFTDETPSPAPVAEAPKK